MQKMMSYMRSAMERYDMIGDGDRVAVGLSGGKDSTALLYCLARMRLFYPQKYELTAISIDPQFGGVPTDYTPLQELCERIEVPYIIKRTELYEIIFEVRKEENPCSLCAKMRRGALHDAAKEAGCNRIALGHHLDDAVETFLMSLLIEGRLSCFRPVTYMDRSGVTQIRPMVYAGEGKIANLAEKLEVPIVENPCPQDKASKRYEIKQLLKTMSAEYPDIKTKIFGAMQRLPLAGWEVKKDTVS